MTRSRGLAATGLMQLRTQAMNVPLHDRWKPGVDLWGGKAGTLTVSFSECHTCHQTGWPTVAGHPSQNGIRCIQHHERILQVGHSLHFHRHGQPRSLKKFLWQQVAIQAYGPHSPEPHIVSRQRIAVLWVGFVGKNDLDWAAHPQLVSRQGQWTPKMGLLNGFCVRFTRTSRPSSSKVCTFGSPL